jgi:hypothetical protein
MIQHALNSNIDFGLEPLILAFEVYEFHILC